jgi:hypothetical protein
MAKNLRDRGYSSSMDVYKLKKDDPASKYHSREKTIAPGTATVSKGQKSGRSLSLPTTKTPKAKIAAPNADSLNSALQNRLLSQRKLSSAYGYNPTEDPYQLYNWEIAEFLSDSGYDLGIPKEQQAVRDMNYSLQAAIGKRNERPDRVPAPKTPEQATAYSDYATNYARYEPLKDAYYKSLNPTYDVKHERVDLQPYPEAQQQVDKDIQNYGKVARNKAMTTGSGLSMEEIKRRMQELEQAMSEIDAQQGMNYLRDFGAPEFNAPYPSDPNERSYRDLYFEYNNLKNEYNQQMAQYLQSLGR